MLLETTTKGSNGLKICPSFACASFICEQDKCVFVTMPDCSDGHKKGRVQEVLGERRRPRIFNQITGESDRSKTFFQTLVKSKGTFKK